MRSSRRNLGLDPDLIPEESSGSSEAGENIHPSENASDNHVPDEDAEEGGSPALADVNLNDSVDSHSDASEDDNETVIITSSS